MTETLLTAKDVSRILSCSDSGVRYLNRQGRISCVRTRSGIRLYKESEVLSLAKDRKRKPPVPGGYRHKKTA